MFAQPDEEHACVRQSCVAAGNSNETGVGRSCRRIETNRSGDATKGATLPSERVTGESACLLRCQVSCSPECSTWVFVGQQGNHLSIADATATHPAVPLARRPRTFTYAKPTCGRLFLHASPYPIPSTNITFFLYQRVSFQTSWRRFKIRTADCRRKVGERDTRGRVKEPSFKLGGTLP